MSTRKSELTRQAARLFAEKGYHGTSIGDLAEAMGVQKGSLYAHIDSKADLLWEVARDGAAAFHAALDTVPDELSATQKIRLALRAHLRVIAEQLEIATVFIREWRYLEGERRDEFLAERRRYEDASARSSARDASSAAFAPISTMRRRHARALRGELGVHLAAAGRQHRRARGSLLRFSARRHAWLRNASLRQNFLRDSDEIYGGLIRQ